jgi:hypothetical protein
MRQGWLGREDSFTATRKLDLYQRIFLDWSSVLKPSEIVVVGWLISNTVWRGRRSGSYSLTQLTNGIPKRDGTGVWARGC